MSDHDHIADKILSRIAEEKVTPRPRWHFLAKDTLFWTLWVISTIAAAVSASAIAFVWVNSGWEFHEITHGGLLPFLSEVIPLIWMVALAAVLFVAYENMRHTTMGYRYPLVMILGFSLLTSTLLGVGLFVTGIGARIEEEIGRRIPLHRPILLRQQQVWTNPTRGLLSGQVVSVPPDGSLFYMRTFDGQEWPVAAPALDEHHRNVLMHAPFVRVIGLPAQIYTWEATSTRVPFHACYIFPWKIQGGPAEWTGFPVGDVPAATTTFTMRVQGPAGPKDVFFIAAEPALDPACAQLHLPNSLKIMKERVGE